jgi:GxxExxY protein
MLQHQTLTERIIGLAIEVHRGTGPGLLESVSADFLCDELEAAGVPVQREAAIPVAYKGSRRDKGFRADLLVDNAVIVEVKAVAALTAIHDAQLLTYLRMSGIRVGLLFNFNALRLIDGLRRRVV